MCPASVAIDPRLADHMDQDKYWYECMFCCRFDLAGKALAWFHCLVCRLQLGIHSKTAAAK